MTRPSWEVYALSIAQAASIRSEDPWGKVGAVVLRGDRTVAATGYNGAPPGVELDWSDREKRRRLVVHAEANALRLCKPSDDLKLLASTMMPCLECVKLAASYGIKTIVFQDPLPDHYDTVEIIAASQKYGIAMQQYWVPRWRWLSSTLDLQSSVYGYDMEGMARQVEDGEALDGAAAFIMWNVFAAQIELAELAQEFSWKPWAKDRPFVERDRILAEAVDVNHFIGNILVACGITDEEYEQAYQKKQEVNRQRAESKTYSARKGGLAHGSDATE